MARALLISGSTAVIVSIAAAYLLGSILFGLLVARYHGVDLRSKGSGNPGASNALRTISKGAGLSVLALDLAKGLLPTLAASFYFDDVSTSLVGAAAVLGHCYPVFHCFRGGKGAATGAGVVLAVSPLAGGVALGVFFTLWALTKKASLGSLGGALVALGIITYEASQARFAFLVLALFLTTLIIWRHRGNIERLQKGQENDA